MCPGELSNQQPDRCNCMLVDTLDPESKSEGPPTPVVHSHLRVRPDLQEEYSPDEIAKMTELYEGTLSNIEEGEIVKSKRSEEHTSELQSQSNLVCRLLLEKKKK